MAQGNGVTGRVLQDVSKPTYEELLEMLAAEKAKHAAPASPVSFGPTKNPKFWMFKHGTKDAWPVSTTVDAWRVIVANIEVIKRGLPKV